MSIPISPDNDPRRWRTLGLLSLAELFGMSLWFAANAVASQLGARWNLSDSELGWLTTVVQLGFVVGTATSALFNLADILPAHGDSALNIPWSNFAWCEADDRSEELNPVVRLKRRMPSLHTMRKVIVPAAAGRHEAAVALLRGGACRTGLFACAKCKCARR